VAAGFVVAVGALVPSGVGSAATVSDSASATITLDSPGSVTVDAFDPELGTLTGVDVSLSLAVLVQACVENTGAEAGALAGGSASASLAGEFPGGAAASTASAAASAGSSQLAASNGSADCAAGFDAAAGRFVGGGGDGHRFGVVDGCGGDGAVHRPGHGVGVVDAGE
jgi:hypothetical protein